MPKSKVTPMPPSGRRGFKRILSSIGFVALVLVIMEYAGEGVGHANLPVIDLTAVSQMIQQSLQMAKQLDTMVQQVEILKSQVASVTGHYGFGALGAALNPWGGTTWQDVIGMVNAGVNPGDAAAVQAYKAACTRYQTANPQLSQNLAPQNPRMNAMYSSNYQDAITGMSMGEQSFDAVQQDLTDLQLLKNKIETTDNVKSAIDLNTAVNIKAAQMNAEILRMNSVQVRLQASSKNNDANAQAAQSEFFQE